MNRKLKKQVNDCDEEEIIPENCGFDFLLLDFSTGDIWMNEVKNYGDVKNIKTENLVFTESYQRTEKIKKFAEIKKYEEDPITSVYHKDYGYLILDGHNRALAAIYNEEKEIETKYLDGTDNLDI